MKIEKEMFASSLATILIAIVCTAISARFVSDATIHMFSHQQVKVVLGSLVALSFLAALPLNILVPRFQKREIRYMSKGARKEYLACWIGVVLMVASSACGSGISSPFWKLIAVEFFALNLALYFVNLKSLIENIVDSLEV